jgi:hypothetical protein
MYCAVRVRFPPRSCVSVADVRAQNFTAAQHGEWLFNTSLRLATRSFAYDVILRVRCSKGIPLSSCGLG